MKRASVVTGLLVVGLTVLGCAYLSFGQPAAGWTTLIDGETARIKPSPSLGEHSAEVLSTWLGLGADEIAGLKSDGVL